jgi:hypothetical protein
LRTSNRAPSSVRLRSLETKRATRQMRFDSSCGTRSAPSPEGTTSNPPLCGSTDTRKYSDSARPHVSKLAPRFEVEAGMAMWAFLISGLPA